MPTPPASRTATRLLRHELLRSFAFAFFPSVVRRPSDDACTARISSRTRRTALRFSLRVIAPVRLRATSKHSS